MGVVYAAYDPELDRKVAVKLLRAEADTKSNARAAQARLLREAQAMARLSHPNVISVHDVGALGTQVFIAMEFVEGKTLTRWLKEKPLTPREIVQTFLQAGKGLAAAHAAGLVHRDFKPDNVLIGNDGRIKVLDFGLARAVEDVVGDAPTLPPQVVASGLSTPRQLEARLTRSGAFLGTPAYMAPEQLLGKTIDARADQFSFCVALYEALYGERPFAANSIEEVASAVVESKIRPPPSSARVRGDAPARGAVRSTSRSTHALPRSSPSGAPSAGGRLRQGGRKSCGKRRSGGPSADPALHLRGYRRADSSR